MEIKTFLAFAVVISLTSLASANMIGTDGQNFNPTTNGVDFVTVQSARTLDPGILNFGLFLNYAVNSLSFLDDADPKAIQNRTKFNDKLLSADLNLGLGITKYLDVGLSLPFLLKQEIANDNQVAYFSSTGNTEQRVNAKFKFHEDANWANALVGSINRNNITNNPYTGANPGLTYDLEFASSWRWSDSWMGVNLGHRFRNNGTSLATTFGVAPLPNMYIYSLAWSRHLIESETKMIFEIFGSAPSQNNNDQNLSDRKLSNLEALAGLKRNVTENLQLHFGGGTEIFQGFGSPDWRLYAGLNWTIGPLWKKSIRDEAKKMRAANPTVTSQKFILSNLRFRTDSDELTEESAADLAQVIDAIKSTANVERISVEGHTDSDGSEAYNQNLSERRAKTVKRLLVTKVPFDTNKVTSAGFGESQPIADNSNYQGRTKNRRVVVDVYTRKVSDDPETLIEIRLTE